jgi:hypothetical protein
MPIQGNVVREILRATTFKDSNLSFQAALKEHGIEFSRRIQLSEAVMASGLTIEIIITGGWGALAVACLAWAHVQKSRKISVTTKDGKSIWLEGYSAKDAEKILEGAKQIAVIDTEKEEA